MKIIDLPGCCCLTTARNQLLRIMKLTMLFLTLILLQVSAATKAQITMNEKNVPLQKALKAISKQSGYDFIYTDQDLKSAVPVSLALNDATIELALQQAFDKQPLQYRIEDKTVMVKKKDGPTFLDQVKAAFAAIDVHGTVLDEKGQPLPGVTVKLKDGNQATITDVKGNFFFRKVEKNAVIQISYIGYLTKEVNVAENLGAITLEVSNSKLDEVKVIAYGTTSQRLSTGSVASINSTVIEKQPVNNPLLALQGRVAGLNVVQSSGLPGGGVTVTLRGLNSLQNTNSPFYVVDGVPYLPILFSPFNEASRAADSPFSYINPDDIESISVLKDADATAIYGSRAANGAILITTKKGKAGNLKAEFNLQQGIGAVPKMIKMLNTAQYLEMREEALRNDNIPVKDGGADVNGTWDRNKNTNWQKYFLGGKAAYTNLAGNISGGSENISYFFGGTYHRETTVFPSAASDKKTTFYTNLSGSNNNKKFKFQFSGSYGFDNNRLPASDITASIVQLAPNAPDPFTSDGKVNWAPNENGETTFFENTSGSILPLYQNRTSNLISNLKLSYELIKGLTISSDFGYNQLSSKEKYKTPKSLVAPEFTWFTNSTTLANATSSSFIIEPQLNYKLQVNDHRFGLLLGGTIQQSSQETFKLTGENFNSDNDLDNINAAGTININENTISQYKYNAGFARLSYDFDNTYLVNLSGRRDGSSRFGPQNRFNNFGAVGLGWIFTNNPLFKDKIKYLSFGKLRASYGTTGNEQIGEYGYYNLYYSLYAPVAYQGIKSLTTYSLSNPYIQWEETLKREIALELGFFNDKLLLTTNYFNNVSSNQLIFTALPRTSGAAGIRENFPAKVQNTGWEFTISSDNLTSKNWKWTTNLNLSFISNKLLAYDNLETSFYRNSLVIGKPVNIEKKFEYAGVDPTTGLYQFKDRNGQLTSTPDQDLDRTKIFNPNPNFYGGLNNAIVYKGFDLDFLFKFAKQRASKNTFGIYYPGIYNVNQPISVLNRWQTVGDKAAIQRYNTDYSQNDTFMNAINSDAQFGDASYIKLKNVSLSWSFPLTLTNKLNIANAKIYISGQNLFTLTAYNGFDPESPGYSNMPPLRVYTLGLKVSL